VKKAGDIMKLPRKIVLWLGIGFMVFGLLAMPSCSKTSSTTNTTTASAITAVTSSTTTLTPVVNVSPTPAPKPAAPVFQIITIGFTLDQSQPVGTLLAYGSVIYHWANGITEVDKPDGTLQLLARDSEAGIPPNPSGREIPATWIVHYPNNTEIDSTPDYSVTLAHFGNQTILTIISLPENY
jgi:hypothetical protein